MSSQVTKQYSTNHEDLFKKCSIHQPIIWRVLHPPNLPRDDRIAHGNSRGAVEINRSGGRTVNWTCHKSSLRKIGKKKPEGKKFFHQVSYRKQQTCHITLKKTKQKHYVQGKIWWCSRRLNKQASHINIKTFCLFSSSSQLCTPLY